MGDKPPTFARRSDQIHLLLWDLIPKSSRHIAINVITGRDIFFKNIP